MFFYNERIFDWFVNYLSISFSELILKILTDWNLPRQMNIICFDCKLKLIFLNLELKNDVFEFENTHLDMLISYIIR